MLAGDDLRPLSLRTRKERLAAALQSPPAAIRYVEHLDGNRPCDHILNWKLKEGSHPFPGKEGGTCINEAAIVAAGFEYQPVRSVHGMPTASRARSASSPCN
jgi:hypothetical protein